MTKTKWIMFGLLAAVLAACASAPESRADQRSLEAEADATLARMVGRDDSLRALVARAPGYAVFPSITSAGLVVGGSGGVGVVYENDVVVGFAEARGGSIGAQIGGQSFSELIVFETPEALARFRAGNFDLSADASATAIRSGAAATARFENGTAVFIDDQSGMMASATIGGQSINFTAK